MANCSEPTFERFLVPSLRSRDIVVFDNLGSHRGKAVRDAIVGAGARLAFLPPYSPNLNPIEQVFAKVKYGMRMAQARCLDTIHDRIARLVRSVPPRECENYIRNAGYAST